MNTGGQVVDDEFIANDIVEDRFSVQVMIGEGLSFVASRKYPGVLVIEDGEADPRLFRSGPPLSQLVKLVVGVMENTIIFPDTPRPCRVCDGIEHLPDCTLAEDLDE